MWKIRSKAKKQAKLPYRHLILPSDQECEITDFVERGYHNGNFVS
jgi:hypothetical protein